MAARQVSIQHGAIMYVHELNAMPPQRAEGMSVRIIGRLLEFDAARARLIIEHSEQQFLVDTSWLVDVKLAPRTLMQFIGEVERTREAPFRLILRARVARNIDGLDLTLYDQVVRLRRAAEAAEDARLQSAS